MKEGETCVACGTSGKPVNGQNPLFIRDRKGRLLCLTCLADAVIDMAIGTQERVRYDARLKEAVPFLNEPPFNE